MGAAVGVEVIHDFVGELPLGGGSGTMPAQRIGVGAV